MGYNRNKSSGFSAVEIVLVVVVVAVLALLGYVLYNNFVANDQQTEQAVDNTSQSATADDVPTAPEINSPSDLDKASATLDEINLDDDSDSSQLDNELSNF